MALNRRNFLAVTSTAVATAGDWVRFRGPNGAGVADEKDLPSEFGPTKNLLWKAPAGTGHSTPIVLGTRVFLTSAEARDRTVTCYNAPTGRVEWTRKSEALRDEPRNQVNSIATSTPTTDGRNIYAFFPDLGLLAYGIDGDEKWRTPVGPFYSMHGLSNSLVVDNGRLYMIVDQLGNSYAAAYSTRDGKLLWKTDRPSGVTGGYSTPSIYKDQVIVSGAMELTGYNARTGARIWWVLGVSGAPVTVPLIHKDVVYVCEPLFDSQPFGPMLNAFDKNKDGKLALDELPDSGTRAYAERTDREFGNKDSHLDESEWHKSFDTIKGAGGLTAVQLGGTGDLTKSAILWRVTRGVPYLNSPVLYEGVLYHVRPGGIFTSLDPVTGKTHKEGRLTDAIGDYYSSPVAAGGKLFIVNNDGKVAVVKAGAQWEMIAANDLGEPSFVTPAIAGGSLFIRTRKTLWCFRNGPAGASNLD